MAVSGASGADYDHPEFYDLEGERGGPDEPDVRFILTFARRAGRALDLGAGSGRVAVWLADAGIPVHCIEPSPTMRSAILIKATQHPRWQPYLTVVPGEAATFSLDQRFPLIYAAGVVQHFLSDEDLLAMLRNVARHLEPGGVFLCDSVCTRVPANGTSDLGEHRIGEMTYRATYATEALSDEFYRTTTTYETWQGGAIVETSQSTSIDRAVPCETMRCLLAEAGLVVTNEFADYSRTPYHPDARQAIIEAHLPADHLSQARS